MRDPFVPLGDFARFARRFLDGWQSKQQQRRLRRRYFGGRSLEQASDEEVRQALLSLPAHFAAGAAVFVNVISDNLTQQLPPKPSPTGSINVGDLVFWDTAGPYFHDISDLTTQASEILDQANIRQVFLGVSLDQILASETAPNNRLVLIDGVCDYPCPAQVLHLGNLIGSTWNGGAATVATAVTAAGGQGNNAGHPGLAIGTVVQEYGASNTSRARFRMTSRYSFDLDDSHNIIGNQQNVATAKALADANYTVLVSDPSVLVMVPTAARTITLPSPILASGFCYAIWNNSGGANSITVATAAGAVKGNATIPQAKVGNYCSDGSNWYGGVSA